MVIPVFPKDEKTTNSALRLLLFSFLDELIQMSNRKRHAASLRFRLGLQLWMFCPLPSFLGQPFQSQLLLHHGSSVQDPRANDPLIVGGPCANRILCMVHERVVHARLIPHGKLSVPTQVVFFSSLNQLASSVWQFVETRLLLMDSFVWRLTTPVSKTRLDTGLEMSFCEIYQVRFENGRFGKFT